ncbi:hypothetical protein [Wolbachia endosymbiont (group A) of Apoderus coryli]|uniref:hypothetical protein n=1 Tax=Wolbachia endosymbiont (group A) of Apoderus coryli TaxID=2953980 RepID=UPI00222EEE73|nr:hypothetical protein [Wolbachia endosymbiont (group A) of Apoderus coryli]
MGSLQQGDSKIKRKTRKGITNQSKNGQDDKILDTVAGSSRDLSQRRGTRKKQIQSVHYSKRQREVFSDLSKFALSIKPVKQGLYLSSFKARGVEIDGRCVEITRGLSQALFLQSDKSFLSNLETSAEIYERIVQGKQVSKMEEREVFAFSKLFNVFEQQLDSSTNSLPSNLMHNKDYKTPSDLSHYITEVKGDFAIHLVTSDHVVAVYRIGDNYAYFDSNTAFVSGLKSVDQLIDAVEKGMKSASYKVEKEGFLVEHFDIERANGLLSSEDKQILAKEIKTECQLLAEQDKELGFIKVNGQEVSRVELYELGTKISVEGGLPLLINADMNLSSKKFQGHLDRKEVSLTAREYLDHLKGSRNVEEIVQATETIPFEGSKREIEKAEQMREPKQSVLEQLVKRTINTIFAAVSLADISRSESQLLWEAKSRPETHLGDVTVNNQPMRTEYPFRRVV